MNAPQGLPWFPLAALQRLLPVLMVLSALTAPALAQQTQVRATTTGFVATTPAIEITVASGAITRIVNRRTGEIHTVDAAGSAASSPWMPRGVLCASAATGGMRPVQTLHTEWGSHPIYGAQLGESIARIARAPGASSTVTNTAISGGMRCTWRGLTDGIRVYPDDTLSISAVVDRTSGQIELTATATTATDDLVGVMVPLVNLRPYHSVYVPSFGGVCYLPSDLAAKRLYALNNAPFVEAPVLVAEGNNGSIALWTEDATFKPYASFFGGDGTTTALGIEALQLMPFEGKRSTRTSKWKICAYRGTWPAAVESYRAWYTRTFAPEIAMREAITWPREISTIVDRVPRDTASFSRLAQTIDPRSAVLHEWNARQAAFDTQLPDFTPNAGFLSLVQQGRSLGFRTMGYVNTHCVNVGSPVFTRDGIGTFGLTRQIRSISRYSDARKTFATSTAGELLYLDPLSSRWRRYHTDSMIAWRTATGADANYEDTGGTAGDFGNGEVEGFSAAQGGWAQFRDLLERNPVPMATEFCPDNLAFASWWTLRHPQRWGTDEVRKQWETRHRPMTSALFGGAGRAWVPTVSAETEARKWTVVSCSDALGGIAQLEASEATFDSRAGLARHMVDRAKLFAQLGLKPHFTGWPKDAAVLCQYIDRSNATYTYRNRDGIQELVNAAGSPLYQRVTGKTRIDSALRILGFPGVTTGGNIGLLPTAHYALAPAPAEGTLLAIDKCPSAAAIGRYVETPDFVLVSFAPSGATATDRTLGLLARTDFTEVIVRDRAGAVVRRSGALARNARLDLTVDEPGDVLLLRRALATPATPTGAGSVAILPALPLGRYVTDASGLDRGGTYTPPRSQTFCLSGSTPCPSFRFVSGGGDSEIAFDHLFTPPSANCAVEFAVRNTQTRYGDGAICRVRVNGAVVLTQDLGPQRDSTGTLVWDTSARVCRVPVGAHAGRPIVLTVSIWGKGDSNADETWVSEARLVVDDTQSGGTTTIAIVPG